MQYTIEVNNGWMRMKNEGQNDKFLPLQKFDHLYSVLSRS